MNRHPNLRRWLWWGVKEDKKLDDRKFSVDVSVDAENCEWKHYCE